MIQIKLVSLYPSAYWLIVHIRLHLDLDNICSVVLLPALDPVCSTAIISSAWSLNLFKTTVSMTLLR